MSALGRKSLFDDDDDPLFSSSTFSSSSSSSSSSSATISSSSSSYKNGGLFDDETENDTFIHSKNWDYRLSYRDLLHLRNIHETLDEDFVGTIKKDDLAVALP